MTLHATPAEARLALVNHVIRTYGHRPDFALLSLPYSHAPGWHAVTFRVDGTTYDALAFHDGRVRLQARTPSAP